jgi:hypothetical protein
MTNHRDRAIDDSIKADRDQKDFLSAVQVKSELRAAKDKISQLEAELILSDERLATVLTLDGPRRKLPPIERVKGPAPDGVFVLLCSDWHVGERVDADQVGGRNEYNPDIAVKRVDKLIDGAKWMMDAWRATGTGAGWNIREAVVWLGGDLITGMIHEDLAESNFLSPTQEVMLAQELAIKVIDAVTAHQGIERVYVPTSFGNHGRDTPDRRVSTSWKRSYEWLMYQMIAKHYGRSAKVLVNAGKDEITRLKVLNTTLRFNHGDQIKYGDGVGGLTIPGRKWLAKQEKTEPADITCIGHHHTAMDIGDLVVNNCLIGWGAYAQRIAPYAPASQMCFLIDEKYGKRMSTELIVQ